MQRDPEAAARHLRDNDRGKDRGSLAVAKENKSSWARS